MCGVRGLCSSKICDAMPSPSHTLLPGITLRKQSMTCICEQDIKAKKAAEFGPFGAIRRDARAASSQDPSPWTSQTLYTSAAQVLSLGFNNLIFVGTQPKACAA